jgi:hypothetical protein
VNTQNGQYRANPVLESVTTMVYTDKKQLVKLISYMSTFDGGLYLPSKEGKTNAQFIMNMKEVHRDYLEWVQATLEQVTGTRLSVRPDYNSDGFTRQPQLRLESNRHPFLTTIRDRIYVDRKKVIDPHMLKLMDAEALAIIFMADGGTQLETRFKRPHAYINLHTKGFSYHDNLALGKAIYEKLNIYTNVHKHNKYYYLNIPKKSQEDFIKSVLPFMCESFLYKLENLSPALGEDIVCSLRERREVLGNK